MKPTCVVCNQPVDIDHCQRLPLNNEERSVIQAVEGVAPQELYCCHPCWRVLQDPNAASQLMKGIYQQSAQLAGVPSHEAERQADVYHARLLERTKARNT